MYKWAAKTQPICIANIRTSMQAKQVAEMIVQERFNFDEAVMDMFYTMAVIRMLGMKWTLQGEVVNDELQLVDNANPYNPLQGGNFNYKHPLFPQPSNVNNILPFDISILEQFARGLVSSRNPNYISMGPRNTPIFELWHSDDWFRSEILTNPEWYDKMKYYQEYNLLPGYTLDAGQAEIIGNFAMRQMPALPRMAESTAGGFTIVQQGAETAIESGNRTLHNYRQWDNAPFAMAVALGKDVGEMLTRPTLTKGIEGMPINPIGNTDWQYWNEYDSACNPEKNMPYFKKQYQMGFKMKNPDAGWGFLYRTRKFRLRPLNTCNLNDLFTIAPVSTDCQIVTIGCGPNNDVPANSFVESAPNRKVMCFAKSCGGTKTYRLEIRRESYDSIAPDQYPLGDCGCGDTVIVGINDADNNFVGTQSATIIEYFRPSIINPNPLLIVETASALTSGHCIAYVICEDATPGVGNVVACVDSEEDDDLSSGQVKFVLDSKLDVDATTDDVLVKYYNEAGTLLGTVDADLVSFNHETFTYVVSETGLLCANETYPTAVSIRLELDD
jgi:hypothetical protein